MINLQPLKHRIQPNDFALACHNWELIENAFSAHGITDDDNLSAVCATVAVETGLTFKPEEERGNSAYFAKNYYFNPKIRKALGNLSPGDAVAFHGRGFVQLTGRNNYNKAGQALGLHLLTKPELACVPANAAQILCWFWTSHGLNKLCAGIKDARDVPHKVLIYQEIRRRVNGALNGLTLYMDVLKDLGVI